MIYAPTDSIVGHLPKLAREALSHSLCNVDNFNIHIYKLKDPMALPRPPLTLKAGVQASSKLIHGTRSKWPPGDLLEKIKSSKDPNKEDLIEVEGVEALYVGSKIKEHFVNSEEKIQGFVYCSGMPPAVILVRLL